MLWGWFKQSGLCFELDAAGKQGNFMIGYLNNSHQDEWNEAIIGNNKTKTTVTH